MYSGILFKSMGIYIGIVLKLIMFVCNWNINKIWKWYLI